MNVRILLLSLGMLLTGSLLAAPPLSPFIKVDQFGYFPSSRKVAVVSNPRVGFNAKESFSPGTGTNRYQVRRWETDEVVFQGTLTIWNRRRTHAQSGDQGWWFDFSEVTAPGSYYVYDRKNNVSSGHFEIGEGVYDDVLKQAARMFYYQRVNYPKAAPYAGEWTDGASFEGPNQDRAVRSVNDRNNPESARDLHGGWYDAGDLNKYTTFTFEPIIQLLEAYREAPGVFRDDYNIPESGNGVPDLLDEIKYELDWLTRMQDATNSGGLLLKVGTVGFGSGFPPSQNNEPRYYVGECTSATITGAAVFAVSGSVFQSLPSPALQDYGRSLIARAERAWARARATTQAYTIFETDCDVVGANGLPIVRAGDADDSEQKQRNKLVTAAAYLYEATGKEEYRTYVETRYSQVNGFRAGGPNLSWPYVISNASAMLRYTTLPDVSSKVAQTIIDQKAENEPEHSLADYRAEKDLYRAHMEDRAHHWGSNQIRANSGNVLMDFNTFSINGTDRAQYREAAEQYVHWLHGVNPLGLVMLSNMYDYGAERSANEISHAWFSDGTAYDNAQTETGPPPGYLVGGPDQNYGVYDEEGRGYGDPSRRPPYGQPAQKSYRDWNTDDDASYAITEPAIYYQASYVSLLGRLIATQGEGPPTPPVAKDTRYVYQDALAGGWSDWSWSANVDFAQSEVVREGNRAVRVVFQGTGSAGVSLRSEATVEADQHEAIQMDLRGEGAGQSLLMYVQTQDNGNGSRTKLIRVRANEWQSVRVPLSELGNPQTIKRITLESASGSRSPLYLDNLRLVGKGGSATIAAASARRVQAYPNELEGQDALHLRWEGAPPAAYHVEIIDPLGRSTYRAMHQGQHVRVDRNRFRYTGMYVVRVYPLDQLARQAETIKVLVK